MELQKTDKLDIKQIEAMDFREFFATPEVVGAVQSALGKSKNAERYIRGVVTTIALDPALRACTNLSKLNAMLTAAQIGLDVDSKGHGYLIPFGNKHNAGGQKDIVFMPGYKGYICKMYENPRVKSVRTCLVWHDDQFAVKEGSDHSISHTPAIESEFYQDETKIRFAYAIIEFKDGGQEFEIMNRKQLDKIKAQSKKRDGKIWDYSYGEMCRKTALRRLAKWQQLPETNILLEYEGHIDDGNKAHIDLNGDMQVEKMTTIISPEPDNENHDEEMDEEKEILIESIRDYAKDIGLAKGEMNAECIKHAHVPIDNLEKAKKENLRKLMDSLEG